MGLAARLGDHPLAEEIRRFDALRFSKRTEGDWDGNAFWGAFEDWRKAPAGKGEAGSVDRLDLYRAARG